MIDWTTIEPALSELYATASGLYLVEWQNNAQQMAPAEQQAKGSLLVVAATVAGLQDETAYQEDTEGGGAWGVPWGGSAPPLREVVRGVRTISIRFRVESYDQNSPARRFAESARTRLQLTESADALSVIGLAYSGSLALNDVDDTIDDRYRSIAIFDALYIAQTIERASVTTDPIERTSITRR